MKKTHYQPFNELRNQQFKDLFRIFLFILGLSILMLHGCKKDSPKILPVVTITSISNTNANTVVCKGEITSDGGSTIKARGFCWSLSHDPIIGVNSTANASGNSNFSDSISDLSPGTTYYIKAYATNEVGVAYSKESSIKTTASIPLLTTTEFTSINSTSGSCGGNITSDGGDLITARGVCWSTTNNPTILNNNTTDGTGIGSFSSSIIGLSPATIYHIRAYATNSVGTGYGDELITTTLSVLPTISTISASSITTTSFISGGTITNDGGSSITERGICWNTSENPTVLNNKTSNGAGNGTFASSISGLISGTTYYIRAYAKNAAGTAYGNQITVITPSSPTLNTTAASSITATSFMSGGNITSSGGSIITDRGVCWNTSASPTISNNHISNGTGDGTFTSSIKGLTSGTTYYLRAYATNSAGTAYGNQITITTPSLPTLSTTATSSITGTSFVSGGTITNDGGSSISARGICWSTSGYPTITSSKTSDGIGIGSFTSSASGLVVGTTYYVRAYATNSIGTAYGEQIIVKTVATLPTITTVAISSITATKATSGGVITDDGGSSISIRGVCWSTSPNPTYNDSRTSDATGSGSFSSAITGLTPGTTYYIRAYASNSAGMSYGNQLTFTTSTTLLVGDSYQGGIVAYIFSTYDPGYDPNVQHGLIAAPNDFGNIYSWINPGVYSPTEATEIILGSGYTNTIKIIQKQTNGTYAASACYNLVWGGYSDWNFPSKDELYKLYLNRSIIGGFSDDDYWSSSEADSYHAWKLYFKTGNFLSVDKSTTIKVRAIRYF